MDHAWFTQVVRLETGAVLGALVRRFGDLDLAEDCLQDAVAQAWQRWPRDGVPDTPGAWLTTVARHRAVDTLRREARRPGLERRASGWMPGDPEPAAPDVADVARPDPGGPDRTESADDVLPLLLLCAHPALAPESQVALTLRAVAGLTTAEIARAFLVPETTVAQRLVRAKRKIAGAGIPFRLPQGAELTERVGVVLQVVYLVFNEGYASSGATGPVRADLCVEAVRLGRLVHALVPRDDEATGLLALVLLHGARLGARTGRDGALVPMERQDRNRWDAAQVAEGVALVEQCLASGPVGPYQLQAAIAAVHAEAPSWEETDWAQIAALYRLLEDVAPGALVRLNRAVAVAMTAGPDAGLALVDQVAASGDLAGHHRLPAVRGQLLLRAGRRDEGVAALREAAELAPGEAERRYLSGLADEHEAAASPSRPGGTKPSPGPTTVVTPDHLPRTW